MLNLTELRKLEENAMPGPWYEDLESPMCLVRGNPLDTNSPAACYSDNVDNLLYIKASCNHYRQLLNIALEAKRRDDHELKIKCRLAAAAKLRVLLVDVEIGDE